MSKEKYIVSVVKSNGDVNVKMHKLGKYECKCCCFWCFLQCVAPYLVIGVLAAIALLNMEYKVTEENIVKNIATNVVTKVDVICDIVINAYE
jgi:stringent starvation protein B